MSTTLAIIKKTSQGFVFLGYHFKVVKKKNYKNYEDVLLSMTNKINLKKEWKVCIKVNSL